MLVYRFKKWKIEKYLKRSVDGCTSEFGQLFRRMTSEGENFREGGDDHFGSERKIKVTILHPDLGIGGAERLIVDAAHALRDNGHAVDIVTNRFSANHCFSDVLEFKGSRWTGIFFKFLLFSPKGG